jgi:hypothetical protein
MKRRSIVSVCVAIATVAAAAVPSTAVGQGPWWYVDGKKAGGATEKVAVKGSGQAAFTGKKSGFKVGPCDVETKEKIWNGATSGLDEVTAAAYTVPCATNIPNCTVTKVEPKKLPWPSVLVAGPNGPEDKLESFEVLVTFDNGAGCQGAGLGGMTVPIAGGFKAKASAEDGCLVAEEAEGLFFEEEELLVDGSICREGEEAGDAIPAVEE